MTAVTVPHRIVTERVVARAYDIADAEALNTVMSTNHVRLREWMPWAWDEPQSIESRRNLLKMFRTKFDAGEDFTMGMFDRSTAELLGGTGLHPRIVSGGLEIGYWLAADAEGQGLMREVAGALTQVAFGLGLADRVQICCDPANACSRRVPEALGFACEGVWPRLDNADSPDAVMEEWALNPESFRATEMAATARPELFDAEGTSIGWPA